MRTVNNCWYIIIDIDIDMDSYWRFSCCFDFISIKNDVIYIWNLRTITLSFSKNEFFALFVNTEQIFIKKHSASPESEGEKT